jgi:hypothetical protein
LNFFVCRVPLKPRFVAMLFVLKIDDLEAFCFFTKSQALFRVQQIYLPVCAEHSFQQVV